jgi:hypothetical protein
MLDDRRRLEVNALAVEQDRDLTPSGKRQKLRRLVHFLLEAHVPE